MIDIAHIHPMLVHFPLALLPFALGVQAFALIRGNGLFSRDCSASFGILLLLFTAAGAVLAAMFGDMALDHAIALGVPMDTMESHEELGMWSAGLLVALALVELWLYYQANESRLISIGSMLAGIAVLAVVLVTAWHGGHLVYDLGVNVATHT